VKRGPLELQEGRQRFSFDERWLVAKYYQESPSKALQKAIQPSKAIDFCARTSSPDAVFFIEVKDFRTHHGENRERVDGSTGELASEVAQKVRDSIAGIVGAVRTNPDPFWSRIGKACASPRVDLFIVLWLELDSYGQTAQQMKPRLDAHLKKLKEQLRWSGAHVMLLNEQVWANDIPGMQVRTVERPQ
jgi:hypothetical protein